MLPVELLSYDYYRRFLDTTQLACVAGGFFFVLFFCGSQGKICSLANNERRSKQKTVGEGACFSPLPLFRPRFSFLWRCFIVLCD